MSAHRTIGLQIEMVRHPQIALAALVQEVLQGSHGHDLPLGIRLTVQGRLDGIASDWPKSPTVVALRDIQQTWREKLLEDGAAMFAALLAMEQNGLVKLLVVCAATMLDAVTHRATVQQSGAELTQAVGLDMSA